MNSEKGVSNYEIVSEESDHHQLDDSAGTKRSYYECTFCKRGFTNAQALGGHMNIHRRDRAKAKAPSSASSLPINNKFNNSMAYPSEISSYQPTQSNYEVYFHPPGAPPHAFQYEFYNPRSQPMRFDQELQGPNLSLQIGPSHVDDDIHQVRRTDQKDGEVDLELRLGHHPY